MSYYLILKLRSYIVNEIICKKYILFDYKEVGDYEITLKLKISQFAGVVA